MAFYTGDKRLGAIEQRNLAHRAGAFRALARWRAGSGVGSGFASGMNAAVD